MDQAAVEQLVMMGFPVNASRRALFNSANNVEMAMDWLCTHIDDPDYNAEFTEPTTESSSQSAPTKPSENELNLFNTEQQSIRKSPKVLFSSEKLHSLRISLVLLGDP